MSDTTNGDYHAMAADRPQKLSRLRRVVTFVVALSLSLGSHASTQALAPAESALAALGVGPLGYAALTITPIALGLVSPLFWGSLWDANKALAFMIAPAGEAIGAVGVAAGLCLHTQAAAVANVCLVLGFLMISACKAGVAIAEFSTVAQLCGRHSAIGFAGVILVKHAMGIVMSWGVPLVLATAHDEWRGITRVQLALLIPHGLSVVAGVALSRLQVPFEPSPAEVTEASMESGGGAIAPFTPLSCRIDPTCTPTKSSPAPRGLLTRIASYTGLSSAGRHASSAEHEAELMSAYVAEPRMMPSSPCIPCSVHRASHCMVRATGTWSS